MNKVIRDNNEQCCKRCYWQDMFWVHIQYQLPEACSFKTYASHAMGAFINKGCRCMSMASKLSILPHCERRLGGSRSKVSRSSMGGRRREVYSKVVAVRRNKKKIAILHNIFQQKKNQMWVHMKSGSNGDRKQEFLLLSPPLL